MNLHKHMHSDKTIHTHAFGNLDHSHNLLAICKREECDGCEVHNIHRTDGLKNASS